LPWPRGSPSGSCRRAARRGSTPSRRSPVVDAVYLRDLTRLTLGAVLGQRMRSILTALGITVGIAAVMLLTSLGEGVRAYVVNEFSQFGTNLIVVTPGRTTTLGASAAVIANVRPLSLDDAVALETLPRVQAVVPGVAGNAEVKHGGFTRRTMVFGTGPDMLAVWKARMALGRFLPADEPRTARAFAVLGEKVRQELFRDTNPLGQRVRIGGESYRVIGVLEPKGQLLGWDLDDAVYIPAGRALALFDRDSLMEIDLNYEPEIPAARVAARIRALLMARHGSEDFTVTTQEDMLATLGRIIGILTLAVGGLGGISLLVGAVGILTIMTIAVNERTPEIGLLRALGATRRQVLTLFLGEATLLSALGGLAGLAVGAGGAGLLGLAVPALPVGIAWRYVFLAEGIAVAIGLVSGVMPARRAARLDPVEALHTE